MSPPDSLDRRARAWNVAVDHVLDTGTSLIGFGRRGTQAIALKVLKQPGDEWRSGEVLQAFDGHGACRVYEHADGALLLERLTPGHSLVSMVHDGRDDDATDVIADVVRRMGRSRGSLTGRAPVEHGLTSFERYVSRGDRAIAPDLVGQGHHWFAALASTQRNVRLLHGDLHHANVLFDRERGWLAIDPKGVVGEAEYEIGALLRNPIERPDLFVPRAVVERRVARFAAALNLDVQRTLAWGFAGAVLSAIWSIEDGDILRADAPVLTLARTIGAMLPSTGLRAGPPAR